MVNEEQAVVAGVLVRRRMSRVVRAGLVLWVFVRVAFFTTLWLTVLLVAYLGYFMLSFLFFLLALALVSAINGWSWVRRLRAWVTRR